MKDGVEEPLANKLSTGAKAQVPSEVAQMVDLALTYNLTNLLSASVTQVCMSCGHMGREGVTHVTTKHARAGSPPDKTRGYCFRCCDSLIKSNQLREKD